MTLESQGSGYTAAVNDHQQAMRHHREASRHYQIGKDYEHAAHQALVAHGHALRAIGHENEASAFYAAQKGHEPPAAGPRKHITPIPRFDVEPLQGGETLQTSLDAIENHNAAAESHAQAVKHLGRATRHYLEEEPELAVREAQIAHRHAQWAVFHGDEAAMHHVEHYGKSGPSAEIA